MRSQRRFVVAAAALAGCGASGAPVPIEQARDCLEREGFRVLGPSGRDADDTDAPDQTLYASRRGPPISVALGYYDDERRAGRSAPEQIEHAKEYEGRVDRHGKLTIIWIVGKDSDGTEEIEDCALA